MSNVEVFPTLHITRSKFTKHWFIIAGDAVLGFLITRQLVRLYPGLNPGRLNDLLQATLNRENFACVAISHGLHKYLQNMSPTLEEQIALFAASVMKEGASPFGVTNLSSPSVRFN